MNVMPQAPRAMTPLGNSKNDGRPGASPAATVLQPSLPKPGLSLVPTQLLPGAASPSSSQEGGGASCGDNAEPWRARPCEGPARVQPKVAAKEHGGALQARGSRATALTHVVGSSQVVSGSAAKSPVSEVGALSSTAAFAVGATAERATLQPSQRPSSADEEHWMDAAANIYSMADEWESRRYMRLQAKDAQKRKSG